MKEICENIDAYIQENLVCPGFKFYGLAETIFKGDQPSPVTVNGRQEAQITDTFDGICYHRLLSLPTEDTEEFSFGTDIAKQFNARLRTVVAFKVAKFDEEFILDFVNVLPQQLLVDGYDMINGSEEVSVITDQRMIYEQEFGVTNYEKHAIPWNIYAVEYNVEFIKC